VKGFRTKLKKMLLMGVSMVLLLAGFLLTFIQKSFEGESTWLGLLREIDIVAAFTLFYFFLESLWKREQNPAKKLGFALVVALVVGVASALISFAPSSGFDIKNNGLIPLGFDSVFWANVYGIVMGMTNLLVLMLIRDIIFSKRRKGSRRNFLIFLGLALLNAMWTLTMRPLDSSIITSIVTVLTIAAMLLNSFRLSWIVYLSKREKLFTLVYGFLLFGIFIGFDVITSGTMPIAKAVLFYSPALKSFISSVALFATIYFGMTFISTLFHLPTAEAFDRKISEVSSLHNLSRLVTQVFDFNELVDSVTTMTLDVCEARSAWLEIIRVNAPSAAAKLHAGKHMSGEETIETVALKNISREDVEAIVTADGQSLRELVLDAKKSVVIDEVRKDRRTVHLHGLKNVFNSMVIVPLVSHERVIGILYATKDIEFGFDQDDVEVISAFADQATIAIENSRLIEKSLERERLMKEMLLAQDMQRKLLPQVLPSLKELEIEALSTPAFEVGGDYYDFTMLDEHHLGVLVGDVSGKGVSAAFYMAEMKGIFQSLARIYRSPKEFLSQAHATLAATIDKRSFISLIYAVVDLRTGQTDIARAGHCPLLYVSGTKGIYVKPQGLALGMGSKEFFRETIGEERLHLRTGDVLVLYTDGVTEAHPKDQEEFGFERLLKVVEANGTKSAVGIRDAIIEAIALHMNREAPEDDLTLVVLRWNK